MPTNDFVPFCNDNTGTNLPTQSAYLANADLPIGNQPGIASSSLNNKALRQGTTIAAIVAQIVANVTGTNVNDDYTGNDHIVPPVLLSKFTAALTEISPIVSFLTAASGTFNTTYQFFIASGNATVGATYTNNAITFTVVATVAASLTVQMSGPGAPTASGTLTKSAGTGDATLTFNAVRAPLWMDVTCVGDGGAGGSCATSAATSAGGGGGAGGGATKKRYLNPSTTSTWAWTVGQGGAPAAAGNNAGGNGSGSTFGGLAATGGAGGGGGTTLNLGTIDGSVNAPGAGSGGDVNLGGGNGDYGRTYGTAGVTNATGGKGGDGPLGLGAGAAAPNGSSNGPSGTGYGSGGAGGCQLNNGGAKVGGSGAPGIIIVEQYFQ